jgi:ribokinase
VDVRACVVGSTNVDLVLAVPALPRPGETVLAGNTSREPGGKGANQACALARLGADVHLVSAVGDDEPGQWCLARLALDGLALAGVTTVPGTPTGQAFVLVDSHGENLIVVSSGANGLVAPPPSPAGFDVVLLSLEIPLSTVTATATAARAAGVPVVLNAAPARTLPAELLACVDVMVLNEPELAELGGDVDALRRHGPATVVVTRGGRGALVVDAGGTQSVAATPVEVVDTTGAGDCFAAALAYGVGRRWPVRRCVELAVVAAGRSVMVRGARGGLPYARELPARL